MKKEDLLKAMGEIDDKFVEEASEKRTKKIHIWKPVIGAVVAAMLTVILLPNMSASVAYAWEKVPVLGSIIKVVVWRDYQAQEGRYQAEVSVPQITIDAKDEEDSNVGNQLKKSVAEINLSIEEMTNQIIHEFEESIRQDEKLEGADHIQVDYEVITNNDDYFCLNVWTAENMGSGWVVEQYYTIDRKTGEILALSDLFADDSYVEKISSEIKKQMAEQMAADENVYYWLEDKEAPDINFTTISKEQSFYISEAGKLVICFNEGDVAPMYMGCVQFEMPSTIWK